MKVYYTVGPASLELTDEMFAAGADGVRMTFSFGTPDVHLERAQNFKCRAKELGKQFYTIADLEGGGMRIGKIQTEHGEEKFLVEKGETVKLRHAKTVDVTKQKCIPIPDESFFNTLSMGDTVIIGDGDATFILTERNGELVGISGSNGTVAHTRGVSVANGMHSPICLTDKDLKGLEHIAEHEEYDAIALSFVSHAEDVTTARAKLQNRKTPIDVIAKIETKEGVENIVSICEVSDTIMIARGDLALYMPWQEMPRAVDTIVQACIKSGTPFMMATQVAASLIKDSMMTRAEMTDLWHWKQEGADSVLLSQETAWGHDPVHAVQTVKSLLNIH